MKALISKSEIKGRVTAPSSKSYTIRGLMCAALAKGKSEIISPLGSDDTEAATEVLDKIGVPVLQSKNSWQVSGGNFREPDSDLFCRESATTLRFMTAISSLVPGRCRLTSAPSLARRPIEPLLQALRQLGVDCYQDEQAIVVSGGKLKGGVTELAGNISSQFVSALLLISPCANEGIKIRLTTPLESQPYIQMTLEYLAKFGIKVASSADLREFTTVKQTYKPAKFRIEGDWSSASYLLALGAIGGEIEVENLNAGSLQGDRVIVDFLKEIGASVTTGENSVSVGKSRLGAIRADLTNCIDLLPTMAVLAAAADGTSQFSGIARARLKESDRVSAVTEGLQRMGIKVVEKPNKLSITGSPARGSVIDSHGDHRIAMAFSLLGSVAGQTTIEGAECVAKTYPEFWATLKSIGGEVKIDGK
ncbi:MAG: 3-phosphoshikimate 1-carboxyvinyltransferase [Chloroflexi bacterium]|nr:3-phosphoshikimate 1-carboxyvinyltransferase [Chloroflexota bacterium]